MSARRITSTIQLVAVGEVGGEPDEMWLACVYPERPPDKNTMYHLVPDCHGCVVAMEANVRRLGAQARKRVSKSREFGAP